VIISQSSEHNLHQVIFSIIDAFNDDMKWRKC